MKKYQDKQIKIHFKQYPQGKTLTADCSIHTMIHLLKIFVCKQFKIPPLQTMVDIFFQNSTPLKPTSTLLQNGIIQNSILTVKIKDRSLLHNQSQKCQDYKIKKQVLQAGLSIKYYCKNQKCPNFQKDCIRNLGFGQFDVNQQMRRIRCQICPYKSQKIHVAVGHRNTIIKHCIFKIKTIEHVEDSIFRQNQGEWIKSRQEKIISRKLTLQDKQVGKILTVKNM